MLIALSVALLLATGLALSLIPAASAAPAAGPDLTVDIEIIPAVPDANQSATIRMVFRNRGTQPSQATIYHLYVNPAQQPPNSGTGSTCQRSLDG